MNARLPRVVALKNDQLDAWQSYADGHRDAKAMHHAAWFRVLTDAFSVRPHFLAAYDERDRICGILPAYATRSVLTGPHLASLDDGILADNEVTSSALFHAALADRDRTRSNYFLLRTMRATVDTPEPSSTRVTVRRIADTNGSVEERFQALSSNTRGGVRRAQKRGYRVVEDRDLVEIDRKFYDEFARNMRELGTPVMGRRAFSSIKQHLARELHLFLVLRGDDVVGGLLCIAAPAGWSVLYGVVRRSLLLDYAGYLLYWEAIAAATRAGAPHLDLGRNAHASDVREFKSKWRGIDIECLHAYFPASGKSVPNLANVYGGKSFAQKLWPRLPLAVTNRLGPVLRRGDPFG